ncbi:MAG: FliH/SctL family protein [Bdellovibrio sp.]
MSKLLGSKESRKAVLEYSPRKIMQGVSDTALQSFEYNRTQGSDFRMSDLVRAQTGLDKIESANTEEEIERRTIERMKEVQESAYQEAHQLGLDDGRKEAFAASMQMIDEKLSELGALIGSIKSIKTELLVQNERHLIELAFHMAKRLAAYEISVNPEATVAIVRQAVGMSQSEENLVVQVSPSNLQFLETLKNETGREFEFAKKMKFESNEEIVGGGCIVISNYGEVDSRMEERFKQLWSSLEQILPRLKEKVSAA